MSSRKTVRGARQIIIETKATRQLQGTVHKRPAGITQTRCIQRHTAAKVQGRADTERQHLPASLISEAIAHRPHVVSNRDPFWAADDADILHREDGKEEVLVGPVIPVLIHRGQQWRGRARWTSQWQQRCRVDKTGLDEKLLRSAKGRWICSGRRGAGQTARPPPDHSAGAESCSDRPGLLPGWVRRWGWSGGVCM